MKYKQPTPRQVRKARKRRNREYLQVQRCYCVCHVEYATRASCKHCHGDNDVWRCQTSKEFAQSLKSVIIAKGS